MATQVHIDTHVSRCLLVLRGEGRSLTVKLFNKSITDFVGFAVLILKQKLVLNHLYRNN